VVLLPGSTIVTYNICDNCLETQELMAWVNADDAVGGWVSSVCSVLARRTGAGDKSFEA